jgi:hypothetical protein
MGYLIIVALVGGYPFQPQVARPLARPKFVPPAIVAEKAKIRLQPGQACAIPLLNVLPKGWHFDDNMVKKASPAPAWSKEIVQPPAPSCDDVK